MPTIAAVNAREIPLIVVDPDPPFTSNRGHTNDEFPLSGVPQPYGDLWAMPVTGGPPCG
jgi:hypothetical protein